MDKKVKILLVDDEADFREPMGFWFKTKGYDIVTAENGAIGVEKVKSENPDIIFLDINMPVMDGVETIKTIREFNKDVPIIFISAYLDLEKIDEVKQYGISGVFYKGGEFEDGLALIEAALRTHKKLQK